MHPCFAAKKVEYEQGTQATIENMIFSSSEEGCLSSTASTLPFLRLQALATMDRIYVLHPKPLAAGRLEGAK